MCACVCVRERDTHTHVCVCVYVVNAKLTSNISTEDTHPAKWTNQQNMFLHPHTHGHLCVREGESVCVCVYV